MSASRRRWLAMRRADPTAQILLDPIEFGRPIGCRGMCGICGTSVTHDERVLLAMNARMVHRGPDDEGVFVQAGGGVGLGARRLSVIDVAGGHQPLANEDATVWAVLN